jgi:hypothetical protein
MPRFHGFNGVPILATGNWKLASPSDDGLVIQHAPPAMGTASTMAGKRIADKARGVSKNACCHAGCQRSARARR